MILFKIAEDNNIDVDYMHTNVIVSFSTPDSVVMDISKMKSTSDMRSRFAHELGHCITGAFYSQHSKFDVREKAEYKADKWAVTTLVPFEELKKALLSGLTEIWQLAEHFSVNEKLIEFATTLYEEKILNL